MHSEVPRSEHSESAIKNAVLVWRPNKPGKIYQKHSSIRKSFQRQSWFNNWGGDCVNSIYNGKEKIIPEEICFMSRENIQECFKSLKTKNVEGYDRIPQK